MLALLVRDISCGHCIDRISRAVEDLGAVMITSDLGAKIVEFDERACTKDELLDAIKDMGYSPEEIESSI